MKRACDSMRDEPFKIVIPIKPDFGGPIATQGTVGEFIDLYKVVQTEGVGIANSLKLARFAALLWKTIERRPHAEQVFDVVWESIFDLLQTEKDRWETKADVILSLTYALLKHKQMTHIQAAELASEELGRTFTETAWRLRVKRWAEKRGLDPVEIYK